ncbi:MAG: thermonuclease family protein [Patescibacteria group bacterium]|nr:thermonuclease family protein [Patescibacteria group bacterium]MDD5121722.1 thermonuclease family protein [Patescibacteria group bacterium]MDD5221976.1 thermonuclease family protein [Patescibacteria group bacterium]MDD5396114.1 thermonuclease family protein [Patescibacteria group bacterium]
MKNKVINWLFILCLFLVSLSLTGCSSQTTNLINQPTNNVVNQTNSPTEAANEVVQNLQNNVVINNKDNSVVDNNQIPDYYSVTKVVDGDTFKVSINGSEKSIRLIGLDTPETVDPRKPVQCFGVAASNKAKELLSSKKVKLEADSSQGDLDKYGRLLRYAFLEDGTFFNKWMIANGYGHEYTYNLPYKYQTEFKEAERSAQTNKLGLWADGACDSQANTQSPVPATPAATGHVFYTSSYYTSKTYYCDTDLAWKNLSPKYLKQFSSEVELSKVYPTKTLHEPCK